MKMTLGNFIATLRKEKRMTQRQLAEILGVSDKTVSHWEREESSPDISLLPIIAGLFEITADELLAGERKTDCIATDTPKEAKEGAGPQNSETMLLRLEQSMNELRIRNIICSAVSILALICGFIVDSVLYRGNTFVCLFVFVISLTMNLIFRNKFELSLRVSSLDEDTLTPYRHKANRMSALNCYLALAVIFFTAVSEYQDEFVLWFGGAFCIAGVIFMEGLLRQAGILKSNLRKTTLPCLLVSAVSFLLIISLILGSAELHDSYTFGYFVRKNAEKVTFSDKEAFIEYMGTEKPMNWENDFGYTSVPGKIKVCALGDDTGYSTTNGIPEYRGTAYLADGYYSFDWRNGEVYEVIISYDFPVEVITFEAYKKSYEENYQIKKIGLITKNAIPITGIALIIFVQIAIIKKITKAESHKKRTKITNK